MIRRLLTGGIGAATALGASRVLREHPPGGTARWERSNHAGEPVTLLEGPAYAAGALAAVVLAPGLSARTRLAAAIAIKAGAGLGAADDLLGDGSSRGLRGHLGALRRGEVTTGAVKVLGLGLAGVVAGALVEADRAETDDRSVIGAAADAVVSAGLVAGTANLVNLLDLRPGRALKVVLGPGRPGRHRLGRWCPAARRRRRRTGRGAVAGRPGRPVHAR